MSDIQWLMGRAGLEVMEAALVGVLSAEVRFRTWEPSVGNEQPRQVCLQHGVCLVQVRGFSCGGVSDGTETSGSGELRSTGIVGSRLPVEIVAGIG